METGGVIETQRRRYRRTDVMTGMDGCGDDRAGGVDRPPCEIHTMGNTLADPPTNLATSAKAHTGDGRLGPATRAVLNNNGSPSCNSATSLVGELTSMAGTNCSTLS
jgi:hypothetical protein